jgi:hypothetical protein
MSLPFRVRMNIDLRAWWNLRRIARDVIRIVPKGRSSKKTPLCLSNACQKSFYVAWHTEFLNLLNSQLYTTVYKQELLPYTPIIYLLPFTPPHILCCIFVSAVHIIDTLFLRDRGNQIPHPRPIITLIVSIIPATCRCRSPLASPSSEWQKSLRPPILRATLASNPPLLDH